MEQSWSLSQCGSNYGTQIANYKKKGGENLTKLRYKVILVKAETHLSLFENSNWPEVWDT